MDITEVVLSLVNKLLWIKKIMGKIKIGIDALGINTIGGGRTSVYNLFYEAIRRKPEWEFIFYLSSFEKGFDLPNVKQIILPVEKGILSRIIAQIIFPFEVIFRGINLFHFTKSQASFIPFSKSVLTIHDITILLYPELHPKLSAYYWKTIQPIMARNMDAIVAVSQDGARGISKAFNISLDKISVIYNFSQFVETSEKEYSDQLILEKFELPKRYLLSVGQIAKKKNLDTLIKSMAIIKNQNNFCPQLVIVGPRYDISDASYIFKLIEDLDLNDYIKYLGELEKEELKIVFKNSTIFLMPSLHEGFGIPCLEAMQLGVPVIASNASALPEVVGDAGLLIQNPISPTEWADAIILLLNSPDIRLDLIKKGKERKELFSQDISVERLLSLFEDLLSI